MGRINASAGAKGLEINGIIEQYRVAAGENISAGDFVEYVNNNVDTQLGTHGKGYVISATKISDTKIFIAYASDVTDYYLYGLFCTIDGTTISTAGLTQISSSKYSARTVSAIALSTTKILIIHSAGTPAKLYAIIGTIVAGNNLTFGSDTAISGVDYTGSKISPIIISSSSSTVKIFILCSYSESYYLYGIVCNVLLSSSGSISSGTITSINNESMSGYFMSAAALSSNKIFIAYRYNNTYIYATTAAVSGTTLTIEQSTQLTNISSSDWPVSVVKISETKTFIAYGQSGYLYGMICDIDGTTITNSINNQLSSDSGTVAISAIALSNNKVFITYAQNDNNYYLYEMICTINTTTITINMNILLSNEQNSGANIFALSLSNNQFFIAHSYGNDYDLYGIVIRYRRNICNYFIYSNFNRYCS